MSEKSTDNDFEMIGLSDCESVGQNHQDTVVLQLPEAFQDNSNIAPSGTSVTTSSFVAVPPHVNERTNDDDDVKSVAASESSWSHAGSTTSGWEGSVASAFEILSIHHGSNNLICQQCTFPNKMDAEICALCEAPLMTGLKQDDDNQQLYDDAALRLEKQSVQLSLKIIECVSGVHCNDGMAAFTLPDLIRHVTAFMKQEQLLRKVRNNLQVVLRDHFSSDYTTGTYERIRRHGFRNPCVVSYNIEAAFDNHIGGRFPSSMMARIPESRKSCRKLGWIVVAIGELDNQSDPAPMRQARDEPKGWRYRSQKVNVSDGSASVEERRSICCLPLVSFDASLRENDSIRQLKSSLSQLFHVDELCELSPPPCSKGTDEVMVASESAKQTASDDLKPPTPEIGTVCDTRANSKLDVDSFFNQLLASNYPLPQSTEEAEKREKRRGICSSLATEQKAARLSSEVIECVNQIRVNQTHLMSAFALSDLVSHVTRFMAHTRFIRLHEAQVVLRYHFSSEYTTGTYEDILRTGFRECCHVSSNIEAAYDGMMKNFPLTMRKLGWIVATIGKLDLRASGKPCREQELYRSKPVKISSSRETVEERSRICLPLASFDASIRGSDTVRQLMSSLSALFLVNDLFVPISCSEVAHPEKEEGEELTSDGGTCATLLSGMCVAAAAKATTAKRSNLGLTTNTTNIAAMAAAAARKNCAISCAGGRTAAMTAAKSPFSGGGIAAAAAAAAKRKKSAEVSAATGSRPLKSPFAGGGIAAAAAAAAAARQEKSAQMCASSDSQPLKSPFAAAVATAAAKRNKSAEMAENEKPLFLLSGEDSTAAAAATAHTNDGFRPRLIGDFGRRVADPYTSSRPVVMHDRLVVGARKWNDADELSDSDEETVTSDSTA